MNTTTVQELITKISEKKIVASKVNPTALEDFLRKEIEVKEYIPFAEKQEIIMQVIQNNLSEVNGIKKVNSISQYVGFITAMLISHTNIVFSDNPIDDYDMLNQSGLLNKIMGLFEKDYNECNTLLKMALAQELEDNNLNFVVARFLDGILTRLDDAGDFIKDNLEDLNLSDFIKSNFKEEDLTHLKEFLDKQQ